MFEASQAGLTLAAPTELERIEMVVAQFPPGPSVHELWIQVSGGGLQLVDTFDGLTTDGDVLTWEPDQPLHDVEVVGVVTTQLPDLAPAWREISLLSPTPLGG